MADSGSGGAGGAFGTWAVDEDGLTCFDVSIEDAPGLVVPAGGAGRVWHQVGNDAFTVTSHADGSTTVYACEAGVVRLGSGRGGPEGASPGPPWTARWGAGYAEWGGARHRPVTRRLWAPHGSVAAVRVDVVAAEEVPRWSEEWVFDPFPIVLGGLMSGWTDPPATHARGRRTAWRLIFAATSLSRALTDGVRRLLGARLALQPVHDEDGSGDVVVLAASGSAAVAPSRPSPLARIPGRVFLAVLAGDGAAVEATERGTSVSVSVRARLSPDSPMSLAVGVAAAGTVQATVESLRVADPAASAGAWRRGFAFAADSEPDLSREAWWHGAMLRSAQVHDAVLDCRYVPQGSAYGFVHGLQGAPRDYAISLVPLLHVDPEGARDLLRLVFRMQRPDGALRYAHTGSGYLTDAGIHAAPSDLPLALCWAACEYVWATGDDTIEAEAIERVLLAWGRLRDGVGFGEHGLLRVGSGDWNDPISSYVPDRGAFHRDGESTYNSAFAVHVLPRAADLVCGADPAAADEMRVAACSLSDAVARTWNGRWFLRGYDGRGGRLGDDRLFVDANAWCLVSEIGPIGCRRALAAEIASRCGDPSPIGATVLDRPMPTRGGILADGWDTNGGVWAAICGLLAWGTATVAPALAWTQLEAQSYARHARAYPRVWYGIWSGPDAYNSHHGDRPGETYVQPATPMTEFPVMNSNADAAPLLGLLGALGVEHGPGGVTVSPRVPDGFGPWRLRTALVDVDGHDREVTALRRR